MLSRDYRDGALIQRPPLRHTPARPLSLLLVNRLGQSRRAWYNVSLVEEAALAAGFRVKTHEFGTPSSPEIVPRSNAAWRADIALLRQYDILFAVHGAAHGNALFCNPANASLIVQLMPSFHWTFDEYAYCSGAFPALSESAQLRFLNVPFPSWRAPESRDQHEMRQQLHELLVWIRDNYHLIGQKCTERPINVDPTFARGKM